jgi:hypothetical protein
MTAWRRGSKRVNCDRDDEEGNEGMGKRVLRESPSEQALWGEGMMIRRHDGMAAWRHDRMAA